MALAATGCNSTKTKTGIKTDSGTMCRVKCSNWGEINSSEEIWLSTEYVVAYDRTMTIITEYNLAGKEEATTTLSEEDYNKLYKTISKMKFKDTSSNGCDGTGWKMIFEDEVRFSGYLGDGKEKKIVEILEKY